jgi:hypothetical protein
MQGWLTSGSVRFSHLIKYFLVEQIMILWRMFQELRLSSAVRSLLLNDVIPLHLLPNYG